MAALSSIAVAATVASTAVSVAGQVSQAKAQKKAAQNQAQIDEANAELAELNAEAQAVGIEKQTEFNLGEIGTDKSILQTRTERELAGMYQIGTFSATQSALDFARLSADSRHQAGAAAADADAAKAGLNAEITNLVARGEYETAVLTARGESGRADIIDEIGLLDADADFTAGQRREEAGETLRRAGAAIVSINARNAYEQATLDRSMKAEAADAAGKAGSLDIQQGEASAQRDDAERALARNETARALEQQQLTRNRDRVVGAARAQAAKSGVAMDGSMMDVMMDVGLDATSEIVRADLAAGQRSDSLSAEMRGRTVQATLYGREAAGVREQSALRLDQMGAEKTYRAEDAARQTAETQAQAQFDAGQLTAQADHLRRQADAKIATLERHAEESAAATARDAAYVQGETDRAVADANRRIGEVENRNAATQAHLSERLALDRTGLEVEADYTRWQLGQQINELKISTAEQTAALDREADMTRWRGETEAANMRDYGTAQAQVLRQSAAASLSAGKSAYASAMMGAGATLLRGGYQAYGAAAGSTGTSAAAATKWGDYSRPTLTTNSTGRLAGGV